MSFYIYEKRKSPSRTCTECGWATDEGYLHEDSGNTYCTTDCLNKAFTQEEQDVLSLDELFWTEWHDEMGVAE